MELEKTNTRPAGMTPGAEEGPYYKAGSPESSQFFSEGVPGRRLILTGYVVDRQGNPIPGAWLDFWQADGNGHYDNSGFELRGHQYTDKSGKYYLDTVIPGGYPGRTPHIHVKVRSKTKSPVFTTQLFLPGMASNKTDLIYKEALQLEIHEVDGISHGTFNFKID